MSLDIINVYIITFMHALGYATLMELHDCQKYNILNSSATPFPEYCAHIVTVRL